MYRPKFYHRKNRSKNTLHKPDYLLLTYAQRIQKDTHSYPYTITLIETMTPISRRTFEISTYYSVEVVAGRLWRIPGRTRRNWWRNLDFFNPFKNKQKTKYGNHITILFFIFFSLLFSSFRVFLYVFFSWSSSYFYFRVNIRCGTTGTITLLTVCVYIHVCLSVRLRLYVHPCTFMYVRVRSCTSVYVHVRLNVCVCWSGVRAALQLAEARSQQDGKGKCRGKRKRERTLTEANVYTLVRIYTQIRCLSVVFFSVL